MRKDYNLEKRKYVIAAFLLVIAAIYVWRLFDLQINDSQYKQSADTNAFLKKTQYPSRGLMYDRNGELVVFNQPAYDVMMIPRDVKAFDTTDFCQTLNITREELEKRFADMKDKRKNPGYSTYTMQPLLTHLSAQDYGRFQEKLYRYPGFFIQKRILRQYNHIAAANVLGNIREVNAEDVKRDEAEQQARALKGKVVIVKVRAGEGGRLYGSITTQEIADALKAQHGITLDKRKIELAEAIRTTGQTTMTLRLSAGVSARMLLNVVAE